MTSDKIGNTFCKYCKSEVAKTATVCPHCKSDLRHFIFRRPILSFLLFLLLIPFFRGVLEGAGVVKKEPTAVHTTNGSGAVASGSVNDERQKLKEILTGVKVVSAEVKDSYGFPKLVVTVRNDTGRDIDAFSINAVLTDNYNDTVRESISGKGSFGGVVQEKIPKGKTYTASWSISLFSNATKVGSVEIDSVHFPDKDETIKL